MAENARKRGKFHQTLIKHEIKHTPRLTAPQKCASADALPRTPRHNAHAHSAQ